MNRLDKLFSKKKDNVLAVYFSAGHPNLNDTATIIKTLDKSGADIVEVGMPFSDPVADGPIIQESSLRALKNGMNLKLLFDQLKDIRESTQVPIVLMGYLNPVMQYGVKNFCSKCAQIGIDGLILPDLPPELYNTEYRDIFEEYKLANILLVTPQSSDERIIQLDKWSTGFLYIVSSSATTGTKQDISDYQLEYFKRLQNLDIKNPKLIGFGISDKKSFNETCNYANGAIIGSAFIKALNKDGNLQTKINDFITEIKE